MVSVATSIAINYALQTYASSYWEKVSIGLDKVPYFFIGMLFGYAAAHENNRRWSIITAVILTVLFFADAIFGYQNFTPAIYSIVKVCFFIYVVTLAFSLCDRFTVGKLINSIFEWLGKYSFELYLLHIYIWFIVRNVHSFGPIGDIVIAIVLSLLLCVPIHILIERICNRIKAVISHA